MSNKKMQRKSKIVASLVGDGEQLPCAFCGHKVNDELIYGKIYAIGNIQCHYFCVLLSCCLVQKGKDKDGLLGFLYSDILAEIERCKKHKCSYCGKDGANLGCWVSQCRKQFHLPCGKSKQAVSLFYDNYKSFCKEHAPKQNIPENVMVKARLRRREDNKRIQKNMIVDENLNKELEPEEVCVICYERVQGYPTPVTFWPPCCARDAWFHRECIQRMALSAGMHYLKCPLCNDKESFYKAVITQGYYVPDRDAAWELEQNAFAEIYDRRASCTATLCACPSGRDYEEEQGCWRIRACLLCGGAGEHARCGSAAPRACADCAAAAPDLSALHALLAAMPLEQVPAIAATRRGPIMPSRMSLRRTKNQNASTSLGDQQGTSELGNKDSSNTIESRQELNLKTPKKLKLIEPNKLQEIDSILLSPIKLLEREVNKKLRDRQGQVLVDRDVIVERMRQKFNKPRPLCVKKRIVNGILEEILNNSLRDPKSKEPIKEWNSPKKYEKTENNEILDDISAEQNIEAITPLQMEISPKKPAINGVEDKSQIPNEEHIQLLTSSPEKSSKNTNNPEDANQDSILIRLLRSNSPSPINTQLKVIISPGKSPTHDKEISIDNLETTKIEDDDESTSSTFQLPPEFIADNNSNDSILFETPKNLKTIDIQKDSSLEIFKNDEIINIDVVKMSETDNTVFIQDLKLKSPVKNSKCAFKLSPLDKERLQSHTIDIDLESFKNHYLNEVDKSGVSNQDKSKCEKIEKALDIALNTVMKIDKPKPAKRKMDTNEVDRKKSRLIKKSYKQKPDNILKKRRNVERKKFLDKLSEDKRIKEANARTDGADEQNELTSSDDFEIKEIRLKKKRISKRSRENIQVKIKFREKNKKIIRKIRKSAVTPKKLTQCILKYSQDGDSLSQNCLVKPKLEMTPIKKRKYVRHEKSPSDHFVQTSLDNFFKIKFTK